MLLPSLFAGLTLAATAAQASPVDLVARNNDAPAVTIKNGTVEGLSIASFSQDAFLGIPYAQPPLNALRFRKPRSLNTTYAGGVLEAKAYPPHCPGVGGDNISYQQGEDCLGLNVVRPAGVKEGDNLPVGLWIHGGGFQMGGSADMRYNGSWVVQRSVEMDKPIIYVSINYRVAALGYLASAEVKASGEQNFGLYDQRLAMHWVHENIAAFGGDPSKVTVWGESAGARALSYHLVGYGLTSTPLFRAAILESGALPIFPPTNTSAYQPSFDAIVAGTGCGDAVDKLECLRGVPIEAFNATASAHKFEPVIDGEILAQGMTESLAEEAFVKVPMLIGTNTDEGASFGTKNLNTTADLSAALLTKYPLLSPSEIDTLLALYPDDPLLGCPFNTGDLLLPSGAQDKRSNAIIGDVDQHARTRRLRRKMAEHEKVYSYRWDQAPQNATYAAGTGHFVEVAYVFAVPNEYKTANTLGNRPGDAELAKLTTSQWVSFIHDLDPNNHGIEGAPTWPNYQDAHQNFVHNRHGSSVETDDFRTEGIDYIIGLARS
ncbi:hypothetical protein JCM6882_001314 [Rhodosporidiobolus microsporus]